MLYSPIAIAMNMATQMYDLLEAAKSYNSAPVTVTLSMMLENLCDCAMNIKTKKDVSDFLTNYLEIFQPIKDSGTYVDPVITAGFIAKMTEVCENVNFA